MSVMVMPKRVALEGVLVTAAVLLYIGVNLPGQDDLAKTESLDTQASAQQTRLAARPISDETATTVAPSLILGAQDIQPRRYRAIPDSTENQTQQSFVTHNRSRAD